MNNGKRGGVDIHAAETLASTGTPDKERSSASSTVRLARASQFDKRRRNEMSKPEPTYQVCALLLLFAALAVAWMSVMP
jgi:hypothetical protein